jgi:hypothetical protein
MARTYNGRVVHTGTDCSLMFDNEAFVYADLKAAFADQAKVTVEIKSRRKPRSLSQNAYLHLCLNMIADETGNSLEVIKTTLKAMYCKKPLLDREGEPIIDKATGEVVHYIQDTSDMDTFEASQFTENVRMFAIDFCGMTIPDPDQNIELRFK